MREGRGRGGLKIEVCLAWSIFDEEGLVTLYLEEGGGRGGESSQDIWLYVYIGGGWNKEGPPGVTLTDEL